MLRQNLVVFFSGELISIIEIYSVVNGFLGKRIGEYVDHGTNLIVVIMPLIFIMALTAINVSHEPLLKHDGAYND